MVRLVLKQVGLSIDLFEEVSPWFPLVRAQQEMMANQDQLVPPVPEVELVQWGFQAQKASRSVWQTVMFITESLTKF